MLSIVANPRVQLKLRDGLLACRYNGTARLLSDDDPVNANAGLRSSCLAALVMLRRHASIVHNCRRFGSISIPEFLTPSWTYSVHESGCGVRPRSLRSHGTRPGGMEGTRSARLMCRSWHSAGP